MIQFGGQTPLKLAHARGGGHRSWARRSTRSTSPRIASASRELADEVGVRCRRGDRLVGDGGVGDRERDRLPGARAALVRPRRAGDAGLPPRRRGRGRSGRWSRHLLVDRFVANAIELDVDALCDGERDLRRGDHAARRGGGRPLRRLVVRPAGALARRCHRARGRGRGGGSRRRSASWASSTSSSRSPTGRSTSWRSTRAPRARCRSRARRPGSTSSTPPAASPPARGSPTSACRPSGAPGRSA